MLELGCLPSTATSFFSSQHLCSAEMAGVGEGSLSIAVSSRSLNVWPLQLHLPGVQEVD